MGAFGYIFIPKNQILKNYIDSNKQVLINHMALCFEWNLYFLLQCDLMARHFISRIIALGVMNK